MTEVWLHANRRVLLMALVPALGLALVGAALLGAAEGGVVRGVAWAMVGVGAVLAIGLMGQLGRPRIAFRNGNVLFHLRSGAPVAVPVEAVEAFFLGQGPANLPNVGGKPAETVNLVARISQKAPQWAKVEVKPALGNWCEGYVTIRGTWCEPLDREVIRRLNRRLREIREGGASGLSIQEIILWPGPIDGES
ncbi:MAG: hypothetical protein H0T51_19810 [Pirellulales bacterium]|nr:hypothetical protein [Pirellulales bacterium]